MESHNGLDSLFTQVLDSAKKHPDFLFSALEGSLFILYVPEGDDGVIRPYHASLQDFLNDLGRSGNHLLDPATNHKTIFHTSARLILEDTDFFTVPDQGVYYAYRNWGYHLCSLINDNITSGDRATIVVLMEKLNQDCSARLARLRSHEVVKMWLEELEGVIAWAKREQNDFGILIEMGEQLQANVHFVCQNIL
ncbi:hypothetical protein M422DRAFT_39151 [Sphaerobolus stellatus SS14]|uniref:Uncharacterized protein n=1 Tax=Sphaerobolus stellatus (strain SS14) TaxID=990650 RepID=A0A0C9TRK9_SPHS4|nr:hypothetical protein M422DRAFT_39151 [Sphaerobolus stellatus SS14]